MDAIASSDLLAGDRLLTSLRSARQDLEKILTGYHQSGSIDYASLGENKRRLEAAFFVLYRAQALPGEVAEISAIIKFLSSQIVAVPHQPAVAENELLQSFHYLLIVAQLTLVCALQQTARLAPREGSKHGTALGGLGASELSWNNLPQVRGSRENLDCAWACHGAKAFNCLAYAVFRQPEVDQDKADISDVEWFLHEAVLLRAYSYIRLCMIPVLQATTSHDHYTALFLFSVLSDLMSNIAHIFTLTVYSQTETDFPHAFIVPVPAFYHENLTFFSRYREANNHAIGIHVDAVDTLEDVLLCFSALAEAIPRFALQFWPQSRSGADVLPTFHPFIAKVMAISARDIQVVLPAIQFLTALCGSGGASRTHQLLATQQHPVLCWPWIIEKLDLVIAQLTETPVGGGSGGGGTGSGGAASSAVPTATGTGMAGFGSVDMPALKLLLQLIEAVCTHRPIADYLQASYAIINKLGAIVVRPVPPEIKAAAYKGLATLASHGEGLSEEVWKEMADSQLLGNILPGATGRGIRAEVEEVDGRLGQYFVLDAVLILLREMMRWPPRDASTAAGGPLPLFSSSSAAAATASVNATATMGASSSINAPRAGLALVSVPSSSVYTSMLMGFVDFIYEEVLLRGERLYVEDLSPAMQAQRWKLLARGLEVLVMVFQYVSDDRVRAHCLQPLLRHHHLLKFVLSLSSHVTSPEVILMAGNEFISSELGRVLILLREHFAVSTDIPAHTILATQGLLFSDTRVVLSSLQRTQVACDPVLWMERCAGASITFLYEANGLSQRIPLAKPALPPPAEKGFRSMQRQEPPLLHDLADLLLGHGFLATSLQSMVSLTPTLPCFPSVNFAAVRLTQKLAIHEVVHGGTQEAMGISKRVLQAVIDLFQHRLEPVSSIPSLLQWNEDTGTNMYTVLSLGGDRHPVYFRGHVNPLTESSTSLLTEILRMSLAIWIPRSLTSRCLVHTLFLTPGDDAPSEGSSAGGASTGLDALLQILQPAEVATTELGVLGFELVYHLASEQHSTIQTLVLSRLRSPAVQYFTTHLRQLASLLAKMMESEREAGDTYASGGNTLSPCAQRAHVRQCLAWVVLTATLELDGARQSTATVAQYASANQILELIFHSPSSSCALSSLLLLMQEKRKEGGESNQSWEASGRGRIGLDLDSASESSPLDLSLEALSQLRGELLQACRTVSLCSAGVGYESLGSGASYAQAPRILVTQVNLPVFLRALQEARPSSTQPYSAQAVHGIVAEVVQLNLCHLSLATCAQLCAALARMVEVVLSPRSGREVASQAAPTLLASAGRGQQAYEPMLVHQICTPLCAALPGVLALGPDAGLAWMYALGAVAHNLRNVRAHISEKNWTGDSVEALLQAIELCVHTVFLTSHTFSTSANRTQLSTPRLSSLLDFPVFDPPAVREIKHQACLLITSFLLILHSCPQTKALSLSAVGLTEALLPLAGQGSSLHRQSALSVLGAIWRDPSIFPATTAKFWSQRKLATQIHSLCTQLSIDIQASIGDQQVVSSLLKLLVHLCALPGGPEGVHAMHMLTFLCAQAVFEALPLARDHGVHFSPTLAGGMRSGLHGCTCAQIHAGFASFATCTHTICALVLASPYAREIASQVGHYLQANRSVVHHVLRLREIRCERCQQTGLGVGGVQAVTDLLCLMLAVARSERGGGGEIITKGGQSLWMESFAEWRADCVALLHSFGEAILPESLIAHYRLRGLPSSASLLWSRPLEGDVLQSPDLLPLQGKLATDLGWTEVPAQWTALQAINLTQGLRLLIALSALLRDDRQLVEEKRDVERITIVARALHSCMVVLSLSPSECTTLSTAPYYLLVPQRMALTGTAEWSMKRYVASIAHMVVCNLLSTLHFALQSYRKLSSASRETGSFPYSVVDTVTRMCEDCPVESTIAIGARYVREELEYYAEAPERLMITNIQ